MKRLKIFVVLILVSAFLIMMTSCGNDKTASSGQQANAGQVIPSADTNATIDGLKGSWTDINAPDRFATITVSGTDYQYEDNEGKYPATFKDGVLKVKVSDTGTADVYVDAKTGHMFSIYQGNVSEFSRKNGG